MKVQPFREIIREFSADFVHLAVPELARQLDLSAIELKPCEYVADSPRRGRARQPDLIAEATVLADPTRKVTLHSAIEPKYLKVRIPRLLDGHRLVAVKERRPVHTIVVYAHGGPAGVKGRVYRETSLGRTTNVLHYVSFGLSQTDAPDFLVRPEPLAWALAARMRPGSLVTLAALRAACLRRIVGEPCLTQSQRFKLFHFVASSLPADRDLSTEFDELIQQYCDEDLGIL